MSMMWPERHMIGIGIGLFNQAAGIMPDLSRIYHAYQGSQARKPW